MLNCACARVSDCYIPNFSFTLSLSHTHTNSLSLHSSCTHVSLQRWRAWCACVPRHVCTCAHTCACHQFNLATINSLSLRSSFSLVSLSPPPTPLLSLSLSYPPPSTHTPLLYLGEGSELTSLGKNSSLVELRHHARRHNFISAPGQQQHGL
jgi:hypothetical protein